MLVYTGQLEHDEQESEARLTELEPQILALQQKVQEMDSRANRLIQDQDVARGTYLTLARKVAEARIAVQDTSGEVQLASRAAVPQTPVSPRRLLNTAVAGALGLMVGVFGAFAMEWWREEKASASTR